MTMTSATQSVPFGAFEIFQMANKRGSALQSLMAWNSNRSARKATSRLTVSQMEDIGLNGAGTVAATVFHGWS